MTISTSAKLAADEGGTVRRPLWREPVVAWAFVGLLFTIGMVSVLSRWAFAGGIQPVHSRPYPISAPRKAVLWGLQAVFAVGLLSGTIYFVRQYRRDKKVSFEAGLFTGSLLMCWLGPLFNHDERIFLVNKYLLNVGTWGTYFPGWHSPNPEHQVIGYISTDGFSWWAMIVWFWIARSLLKRVCSPQRPWRRTILAAAGFFSSWAAELLIEPAWLATGSYSYAAASPPGPVLFSGQYQLPVIETILVSLWVTAFVVMDRFARDRGTDAVVLRGSDRLSPRARPWVRLLSMTGVASLLCLFYILAVAAVFSRASAHINPDLPSYLIPDGG